MTKFNTEQIKDMEDTVIGKNVTNLYHEPNGDYFVMDFDNGTEITFRFMGDLKK